MLLLKTFSECLRLWKSRDWSRDILCVLPAIIFLPLSKIKCRIRSTSWQNPTIWIFCCLVLLRTGWFWGVKLLFLTNSLAHAPSSIFCSSQLLQCLFNLAAALTGHFLMKMNLIKSDSGFFLGTPSVLLSILCLFDAANVWGFFGFFGTFRIGIVHKSPCDVPGKGRDHQVLEIFERN